MSHLACPLCGLNAPLSYLDPSELDLDLTLKAFKGLGRGKGFECISVGSVLGDDKYTPMIFNRIADLCTMFYMAGCSAPDGCMFAKLWQAEKEKSSPSGTLSQVRRTQLEHAQIRRLKEQIEGLKKTLIVNKAVEWVLGCLMENSEFSVITEVGVPWVLWIRKVREGFFKDLLEYFDGLSTPIRQQLKTRVRSEDDGIRIILEEFLFKSPPRKKSVSDRMFDVDLSSGGPPPF
jgi:hypothetical protein